MTRKDEEEVGEQPTLFSLLIPSNHNVNRNRHNTRSKNFNHPATALNSPPKFSAAYLVSVLNHTK